MCPCPRHFREQSCRASWVRHNKFGNRILAKQPLDAPLCVCTCGAAITPASRGRDPRTPARIPGSRSSRASPQSEGKASPLCKRNLLGSSNHISRFSMRENGLGDYFSIIHIIITVIIVSLCQALGLTLRRPQRRFFRRRAYAQQKGAALVCTCTC